MRVTNSIAAYIGKDKLHEDQPESHLSTNLTPCLRHVRQTVADPKEHIDRKHICKIMSVAACSLMSYD